MIEQGKLTYFPFGKALEKRTKAIEDQVEKQKQLKVTKNN